MTPERVGGAVSVTAASVTPPAGPAMPSDAGAPLAGGRGASDAAGAADEAGAGRMVVGFVRALRRAGLAVPVGSAVAFTEALGLLGVGARSRVYWAGRATLVRRPEDAGLYDRVFAAYWLGRGVDGVEVPPPPPVEVALDDGTDDEPEPGRSDGDGPPPVVVRWSTLETLRDKDFADYTPEDWREYHRLVACLRLSARTRRARRRHPARRRRSHPDLRRTVRAALRTDGEPILRAWQVPRRRPRRLVLLVDVSGSMESYARALLRFAHAAVCARGASGAEVFTLGTRLTRITRELAQRDPDAALGAAAESVADWSGGTRLGAGLREFNDRWGVRGAARGAVVVVLSDGWDRGDPDELAEQMARLGRVAHRLVWVNPLKASPGYAPLARGMAAALPHVDEFVEGHSLAALEHLAGVVGGSEQRGNPGRGRGERRAVA
jgi:uncharacterized protein with von Willebrand factor type A (vWA) domain